MRQHLPRDGPSRDRPPDVPFGRRKLADTGQDWPFLAGILPSSTRQTAQQPEKESAVLTLKEVAQVLRCSKTHVSNMLNGKVLGLPRLTHFALGRRKLVRREWLEQWMEANKVQC